MIKKYRFILSLFIILLLIVASWLAMVKFDYKAIEKAIYSQNNSSSSCINCHGAMEGLSPLHAQLECISCRVFARPKPARSVHRFAIVAVPIVWSSHPDREYESDIAPLDLAWPQRRCLGRQVARSIRLAGRRQRWDQRPLHRALRSRPERGRAVRRQTHRQGMRTGCTFEEISCSTNRRGIWPIKPGS